MKHTRLVFLLLDQSAVDAFKNDQIDILRLNTEYSAHKAIAFSINTVPPENDRGAFELVDTRNITGAPTDEVERRYFICADTTMAIPAPILNALIDKIKEAGNNFTYINTCNRDMRVLWEYLAKPTNNQQQESTVEQSKKLHPKTVNIILSGINASAALHDGGFNIAGLADEMIARGGRVFTFRQKGQTAEANIEEAKELIAHLKDPQRHLQNHYVVITNPDKAKQLPPEAEAKLQEAFVLTQETVNDGDLNLFTFGNHALSSQVAESLYVALYQAMTPQFHNPIIPPNTVSPQAMQHMRQQLQYAQQSLQAIGLALTMTGVPGQGANFQAFGRGARPFPGQPVGFGAQGEPMLFGGPAQERQFQPFSFAPYDERQVQWGTSGYPQNLYGDALHHPFIQTAVNAQRIQGFEGVIVVHVASDNGHMAMDECGSAFKAAFPLADISVANHSDCTPDTPFDTIMENVMTSTYTQFGQDRRIVHAVAIPDYSEMDPRSRTMYISKEFNNRGIRHSLIQLDKSLSPDTLLRSDLSVQIGNVMGLNARFGSPFKPVADFAGNVVVHYVGAGQEGQFKLVSEFVGKQMPHATIIPVGYDDTQELDTIAAKVAENLAWRSPKTNIHLVMLTAPSALGSVPSVDVIAQGIFNAIGHHTPSVETVRPNEVIAGPALLHKLLGLVSPMQRYPSPRQYRFGQQGLNSFSQTSAMQPLRARPQMSMSDLMVELDKFDGVVVFHSVGIDASIAVEDAWKASIHPTMTAADFKHYNYSLAFDSAVADKVKANVGQATDQKQLHLVVSDARFAVTNQTASARMGYEIHGAIARHGNFAVGLSTPEELRIDSHILDNLYHLTLVQQQRTNQKF